MLKAYTREKKMGKDRISAQFKMATEAAYIALKCKFVCLFPTEVPPVEMKALIKRVVVEDADTENWLNELIENRKIDKNAEYNKTNEYKNFLAEAE